MFLIVCIIVLFHRYIICKDLFFSKSLPLASASLSVLEDMHTTGSFRVMFSQGFFRRDCLLSARDRCRHLSALAPLRSEFFGVGYK